MIDFVIGGGSLLHTVREADLGLILHGHRTLFAAMHRAQDFGVDFMVWAKLFRAIGGDQMHTGTPGVGVMSAKKSAVIDICTAISYPKFVPAAEGMGSLEQDFSDVLPVAPICGAGLDPITTSQIVSVLGADVILFAGGGVHGHPQGTRTGAASMRESVNALRAGVSLGDWTRIRQVPWLTTALEFFGKFDKQSPNPQAREAM